MKRILALRKRVDEIDEEILCFLKERLEVCKSIGAIKQEDGIPIRDYQREDEVYTNIFRKASELELDPYEIKSIYRKIVAMGARAQESNTKT